MADIDYEELHASHAKDVAALHVDGIPSGFISSLGLGFVTALYETIGTDAHAFGIVAKVEEDVIGFVVFTSDVGALYKTVLRRGGLRFAWLLARRLFSWSRCRRILQTLLYARDQEQKDLPAPELLALAVLTDYRQQGIGQQLIEQGLAICQQQGLHQVKVCVGEDLIGAQRLYQKAGFMKAEEIVRHGRGSILYVADVRRAAR